MVLAARALRPLVRYFDAVDELVSAGMVATRPHLEVTMTSILCDLMDKDEQHKYRLRHNINWLRRKLNERITATDVSFDIQTLEYPRDIENLVTQADVGLIIEFDDILFPKRNWTAATVLQAKRLRGEPTPSSRRLPPTAPTMRTNVPA